MDYSEIIDDYNVVIEKINDKEFTKEEISEVLGAIERLKRRSNLSSAELVQLAEMEKILSEVLGAADYYRAVGNSAGNPTAAPQQSNGDNTVTPSTGDETDNTWIIIVAIIGGVTVIALLISIIAKKKKK